MRSIPKNPFRVLWLAAMLWSILPIGSGVARADFKFILPSSNLAFELTSLPPLIRTGDFSLLMWVWIDAPEVPSERTLVSIPESFDLTVRADGKLAATLSRPAESDTVGPPEKNLRLQLRTPVLENEDNLPTDTRTPTTTSSIRPGKAKLQRLIAITPAPATTGAWTLVCVRLERQTGRISIWSRSDGSPARLGVASNPAWKGFAFEERQRLYFGGNRESACLGLIGVTVLRSEIVTPADLDAVFNSRRCFAPLDTDRRSVGGVMSGPAGAVWMIGHSMPTFPSNGTGASTFDRAAVVGRLVNKNNVTVYVAGPGTGPQWNLTKAAASTRDLFFAGHGDEPYNRFFIRDRWNTGVGPGWVPGVAPAAAELLKDQPTRQLRMIASSNSRGVKNGDGSGLSPGNYAHGFIEKYRANVCGILMRPAVLTSGGNPWFGFDCSLMNPAQSAPGTIFELSSTTDNSCDFARFFTGSAAFGRGPGAGLFMLPGSNYSLRCRPENLSLLNGQSPLDVEAYVMAFPGASPIRWRGDRGPNQAGTGSVGAWITDTLDTARITLMPDPIIFQTSTIFAFFGDQRANILVGDACVITQGPGARCISLVKSIAYDGIRTRVTLEKPVLVAPTSASTVKFGPWELRAIRINFPAQPPTDPNTWRGIGIVADAGGIGFPVYAFSAVRTDTNGYIFGTAGWGGHGYQQQLDNSFAPANVAWMALTKADVWFQVPAQQLSLPPVMSDYTDLVRAALPTCDVIWAGESGLFADPAPAWHQYILTNAAAKGVVGLSVLEHPRIGDLHEQYADGMLSDNDHYSQRGNRRLADIWVAQLRQALRTGCPADFDNSGTVDPADLASFEADLAQGKPDADINADGLVDDQDLAAFLAMYASGC